MGEAEYPRDLLQRLNEQRKVAETKHDSEEIELNLGLSLGGRFGVDPKESKLVRSSSIAGLSTFLREDDAAAPPLVPFPLSRTTSLPMETDEDRRKKKEIQSLRRFQAKRKRDEKRTRCGKHKACLETICKDKRVDEDGLNLKFNKRKVEGGLGLTSFPSNAATSSTAALVAPPFGTPNWPRSSLQVSPKGKASAIAGQGFFPPSTQGSVTSNGNTSSGNSKSEGPSVQGPSNSNEVRSGTSIPSSAEPNEQMQIITPELTEPKTSASVKVEVESPTKKPRVTNNDRCETGKKLLADMPCVSTTGDGPNGRSIQGFLYQYKRGEEVRIVCVCHGRFLTPAEFVRHAGGSDVEHPLKHIVVTTPL